MLDFQVVYVRDNVKLQGADQLPMLKIVATTPKRGQELSTVKAVTVDGLDTKFFSAPDGSIFLTVPANVYLGTTALMAKNRPGVPITVKVRRSVKNADGTLSDLSEPIDPQELQIATDILRVTGDNFNNAVEVLINNTSVKFVVVDPTSLLCQLPKGILTVETVEVLSSTNKLTGASTFAYMLGATPSAVGGIEKLVHQFIKLLWTTQGSDTFNKNIGGNLQKFAGSRTDQSGADGLIRVVTDIQRTASLMTAGQLSSKLPQDETLAVAELTGLRVSPDDPTSLEIDLKLQTLSGLTAFVNLVAGNSVKSAQSLSKKLLGAL